MNATAKTLLTEIDKMLELSSTFVERYKVGAKEDISPELFADLHYFHSRLKYIFEQVKPEYGGFMRMFMISHVTKRKSQLESFPDTLEELTVKLKTLKRELEDGLLYKITDLIKAEVFDNFLDTGKYFLDAGHKDAAAVMIGGVLEEKLRNLCLKNSIPVIDAKGRKLTINSLNDELYRISLYPLFVQKSIIAWADIRNNAAHAQYGEYTAKNVQDMYDFVMDFEKSY